MTAQEFTHPDDAAALKKLESIPLLPTLTKTFMDVGAEQMMYGTNMATKVKLSPTQLPKLYNILPPLCARLGIKEPEFFLEMTPVPNAYAFGDTYTAITITSGIVDLLTEEELIACVAHECGHILCRHMLYHTMASLLINGAMQSDILGAIAAPLKYALLYWNRKSELSCDRVATFCCGPETTIRLMTRLAGGPKNITDEINLVEFAEQADQYDAICKYGMWNKALQTFAVLNQDHPFASVRVRETLRWVVDDKYKKLREKYPSCPHCYREIKPGARFCTNCGKGL